MSTQASSAASAQTIRQPVAQSMSSNTPLLLGCSSLDADLFDAALASVTTKKHHSA
jgi:hypothetical protein